MRKSTEAVRDAQEAVREPKSELIRILGRLESAGVGRKAAQLAAIIGRLEAWQNNG